jgi:hypothetical protein
MAEETKGAAGTTEGAAGTPPPAAGTTGAADAGKAGGETKAPGTTAAGTTPPAPGTGSEPGSTAAGTPPAKAPDKYELRIPEGGERFVGPDDLKFVENVARANGWTQEEAQAELADAVKRSAARETQVSAAFLESAKADREYGGAQFGETQRLAQRAIDRIRPDGHARRASFLSVLERGGAKNNIEVLAFLADLGKGMSEDAPGAHRSAMQHTSESVAEKFYDHPSSRAADGKS